MFSLQAWNWIKLFWEKQLFFCNKCIIVRVNQLTSIITFMYDLWYPLIPDNFYRKNSPWILVTPEALTVATSTKQDLSSKAVGVSDLLLQSLTLCLKHF